MKWAYSIQQKLRAATILAVLFLLVFAKNLIDKNNLSELKTSFSSVYEDRLLVENYIYQISSHLYQKENLIEHFDGLDAGGSLQALKSHNAAIDALLVDYEKTRFTEAEISFFHDLKQNLHEIRNLEGAYLHTFASPLSPIYQQLETRFQEANKNLQHLSSIQIAEGKQLTESSQKIMASSTLLSQFELVLIIVVGLIIQALVFASRSVQAKLPQDAELN